MAKIDVSATDAARRIALQMLQERGRVCWQPRRIRDVGSSGRIPELMNKQRPLSLAMIRKLVEKFDLPADVLIRSTGEGRSFVVPRAKRVKARVAM